MLIVGSRALNYHFPDYKKKVNDWDFIGNENEVQQWFNERRLFPTIITYTNVKAYLTAIDEIEYEFEIAVEGSSAWDYLKFTNNLSFSMEYAPIEVLYSLKKSHIHRHHNYNKHINDYYFLESILLNDSLESITKKRILETDVRLDALGIK